MRRYCKMKTTSGVGKIVFWAVLIFTLLTSVSCQGAAEKNKPAMPPAAKTETVNKPVTPRLILFPWWRE